MKKFLTVLSSLVLMLILTFSLVACNNQNNKEIQGSSNNSQTDSSTENDPVEQASFDISISQNCYGDYVANLILDNEELNEYNCNDLTYSFDNNVWFYANQNYTSYYLILDKVEGGFEGVELTNQKHLFSNNLDNSKIYFSYNGEIIEKYLPENKNSSNISQINAEIFQTDKEQKILTVNNQNECNIEYYIVSKEYVEEPEEYINIVNTFNIDLAWNSVNSYELHTYTITDDKILESGVALFASAKITVLFRADTQENYLPSSIYFKTIKLN